MKSKFMTLLLSVAIAFGLWIYVITVEQPESQKTYYDIPVVLQNESILAEPYVITDKYAPAPVDSLHAVDVIQEMRISRSHPDVE